MNLTEALDVALPELPAKRALKTYPKLHPKIKWREQIEDGKPAIAAHIPGDSDIFRFTREQWDLLQLFDGRRSYQEIAQAYQDQTNIVYTEDDISQFAASMRENGLWQQTVGERYGVEHAHKHLKARKKQGLGDLAHIDFSAWDPDAFFTWLHPYAQFLYSGWFTLLTLCLFAFMSYVFLSNWGEIGQDTIKYYNFTEKGLSDLVEFWFLFFFLGFFHESAHGLTCKHFGGGVHRMGFMLLYLQPCFFVDVTEALVYSTRLQRMAVIMAGIWTELIFCSLATIVWWGTATGSLAHEFAYKVMLVTGVAVVVLNVNPLIKIDGYYFLCELLGISEIKERSTAFVNGWMRRNILGLPAIYEHLTPRRKWFFILYALASGAYSYLLLFAVTRFSYNVSRRFYPEWAFVPALCVVYLLFGSRLRKLWTFMKTLYLDKKERLWAWLTTPKLALLAAAAGIILFAPFWPESIDGRFVLEPAQRAVVRAEVPGQVSDVFVDEGSAVAAGLPLVRLRNLGLETRVAIAQSEAQVAAAHAREAELKYAGFGTAEREKDQLAEQSRLLLQQEASLNLSAPIAGIVTTPRLRNLLGSNVKVGQPVVEVADLSTMRARIYMPEAAVEHVRVGAKAVIKLDSRVAPIGGRVASIAPAATDIEPGLVHQEEYKGIRAPTYYVATLTIPNDQRKLLDGTSGTAKIYWGHRSVAGLAWREVREFVERKIW